jgi:hypothetical protein
MTSSLPDLIVPSDGFPVAITLVAAVALVLLLRLVWRRLRGGAKN